MSKLKTKRNERDIVIRLQPEGKGQSAVIVDTGEIPDIIAVGILTIVSQSLSMKIMARTAGIDEAKPATDTAQKG